jgi:prefoldin subunit 5
MKKVLLSLLAVAALVLSCQNYDDEFDALNAKVASLESQITSLQSLQTTLATVQSSVSALQAAVSAIPNLSSEVAAILADLEALATASSSTSADLDALKAELNTTLSALRALIEDNADEIASIVVTNQDLKDQLDALGIDVDEILDTIYTYEGDLTINDAASLAFAKNLGGRVRAIKGNVSVDINVSNALSTTEVNAVTSLIQYVNGNVSVNGYNASIDLSKLTNITEDYIVTGYDASDEALIAVGDDVYFNYDGPYVSNIQMADNIYLVMNPKVTSTTAPKTGTTSVDFTALTKASGVQTVTSAGVSTHTSGGSLHTSGGSISTSSALDSKVIDANATTTTSVKIGQAPVVGITGAVLETVELHYAALGTTASPALASLSISGAKITSATVKAKAITAGVSVTVKVATTASPSTGSLTMAEATTVGGAISSNAVGNTFTALTSVAGITLSADTSASFPALTKSSGAIVLTTATTLSAPVLKTMGTLVTTAGPTLGDIATRSALTANKVTGTVTLPALESAGALSFTAATAIDAKKANVTSIDLDEEDNDLVIDLGSVDTSSSPFADIASIVTLNLHAQTSDVASADLAGLAVATSLTILGDDSDVDVALVGSATDYEELLSITLGGTLGIVSVSDMVETTTITTSGTIAELTIDNNDKVATGLTLNHTEDAEVGAKLTITRNALLTGFTTKVNRVQEFVVTNNPKLAEFNASSMTTLPNDALEDGLDFTITVTGNFTTVAFATATGMKGSYIADTASTDETFKENSLNSLKPYLTLLYNEKLGEDATFTSGNTVTVTLNYISVDLDSPGTASVTRTPVWADAEHLDITAE